MARWKDRFENPLGGVLVPEQKTRTVLELDLRGQICPATLLKSLRELNRMKGDLNSGFSRLDILTTNRDSMATVSDAASSMGYKVAVRQDDAHYRLSIEGNE
jgi:TusA-related sulfurtransferase